MLADVVDEHDVEHLMALTGKLERRRWIGRAKRLDRRHGLAPVRARRLEGVCRRAGEHQRASMSVVARQLDAGPLIDQSLRSFTTARFAGAHERRPSSHISSIDMITSCDPVAQRPSLRPQR